jgi:hypothetical protein
MAHPKEIKTKKTREYTSSKNHKNANTFIIAKSVA